MSVRSSLFPILLVVTAPAALEGQTCPMGQPRERSAGLSQVEPHPPAVVKRKVPELLNRAGYWIEAADTASGRFVTVPIYSWSQRRSFDPWRHLVHPGVVVTVTVTAVERWSRVSLEVRVLCETGQRPPGNVLYGSAEAAVSSETLNEVTHLVLGYFHDAGSEVRGPSCTPLSDGDRKIRICREIARRNPGDGEAQLQHALSLINFFRWEEARGPLDRALTLLGARSDVYDTVVAALRAAKAEGEIMRVYRRALEALPRDPKWHMALGIALADSSRYGEALEHFERGAALVSDDPDPHYAAAWALHLLHRPDEAARHCATALPLMLARLPDRAADANAWVALGFCAAQTGRHAEAVAYFERAVRIDRTRFAGNRAVLEVVRESLRIAGPQEPAPVPTRP